MTPATSAGANSELQCVDQGFEPINRAYNAVFRPGRLSLGVVVPLETYTMGPVPSMTRHAERVQLAEELGFSAVWLRDVPFNVPTFGDAGQMFDPFVYLGLLAASTERIALGVASIVLPLRHPAHVAKAAASVDVQSLYVDLVEDPETPPQPIHLGFRLGTNHLRAYLKSLEEIGVNHVALNLRLNQADIEVTLKRLADDIPPDFASIKFEAKILDI